MTQATFKLDDKLFNREYPALIINNKLPVNLRGCVKGITQVKSKRLFSSMITVDLEQPDGSVERISFQVPRIAEVIDVFGYIAEQILEHFDE